MFRGFIIRMAPNRTKSNGTKIIVDVLESDKNHQDIERILVTKDELIELPELFRVVYAD